MNFAIIVSKIDPAGLNIKERLLEMEEWQEAGEFHNYKVFQKDNIKLYTVEKESIFNENIDKEIEADFFLFATKHQSKSGVRSLSVHTQGNWAKAEFGGEDRQLCMSPACYLKEAMKKLEELNNINYEVIQECTHHGPFLEKPTMFIEIGSTLEEWNEKDPAVIIAKTIFHLFTTSIPEYKTAVGIGGLHHTPNFKKIILNSDIAIGHVCPKYMLEYLDEELIKQAMEKTTPKAELVILDWKGLGQFKEKVKEMTENYNVKKTKEF